MLGVWGVNMQDLSQGRSFDHLLATAVSGRNLVTIQLKVSEFQFLLWEIKSVRKVDTGFRSMLVNRMNLLGKHAFRRSVAFLYNVPGLSSAPRVRSFCDRHPNVVLIWHTCSPSITATGELRNSWGSPIVRPP